MTTWTDKIKGENLDTCCICNKQHQKKVLQLHHVDPKEKTATVGSFREEPNARREAQKCILVCGNCHTEIHCDLHPKDFILSLPRAVSLEEIIPELVVDPNKKKSGRPKKAKNKKKNEPPPAAPSNIIYNIHAPDYTVNCIRYSFQITFLTRIRERLSSRPKSIVDFDICLDLLKIMLDMGLSVDKEFLLEKSLKDRDRAMAIIYTEKYLQSPWNFTENIHLPLISLNF